MNFQSRKFRQHTLSILGLTLRQQKINSKTRNAIISRWRLSPLYRGVALSSLTDLENTLDSLRQWKGSSYLHRNIQLLFPLAWKSGGRVRNLHKHFCITRLSQSSN